MTTKRANGHQKVTNAHAHGVNQERSITWSAAMQRNPDLLSGQGNVAKSLGVGIYESMP